MPPASTATTTSSKNPRRAYSAYVRPVAARVSRPPNRYVAWSTTNTANTAPTARSTVTASVVPARQPRWVGEAVAWSRWLAAASARPPAATHAIIAATRIRPGRSPRSMLSPKKSSTTRAKTASAAENSATKIRTSGIATARPRRTGSAGWPRPASEAVGGMAARAAAIAATAPPTAHPRARIPIPTRPANERSTTGRPPNTASAAPARAREVSRSRATIVGSARIAAKAAKATAAGASQASSSRMRGVRRRTSHPPRRSRPIARGKLMPRPTSKKSSWPATPRRPASATTSPARRIVGAPPGGHQRGRRSAGRRGDRFARHQPSPAQCWMSMTSRGASSRSETRTQLSADRPRYHVLWASKSPPSTRCTSAGKPGSKSRDPS